MNLLKRLQEVEDLFPSASPEEVKARKLKYQEIKVKEWVDDFLKHTDITKNPDGSYDVKGNVDLSNMKLIKLPIKFGKVGGHFYCYSNQLISLEGAPSKVGGNFDCSGNKLTSLKGAPKEVGGHFYCEFNQLISLEGAPSKVGGNFYCRYNKVQFTEEDVRKVCKVKGSIWV